MFHTLEVTSCVRDTEASSEYIFQRRIHTSNICKFQQSLNNINYIKSVQLVGARGGIVVKALCYKLAGHGFDSRLCHWNFSVT